MNQDQIMVSVVVLTYNHEKYIRQALNGILEQKTSFRYEVLVGDDASTDGTSEIVREYARNYSDVIKPFIREKNLGATNNLYDLFQHARGKYIAACEGDDFWIDSRKLQKQVDFLEKHQNYCGCTHDVCVVDEKGTPKRNQYIPWICNKRTYTAQDFNGIFLPGHSSSVMRRNYFLQPEFDGSFLYQADAMIGDRTLAMLWVTHGDFYRLKMTMSCYRQIFSQNNGNATSQRYYKNPNRVKDDWEYTLRLEKYNKEMLKGKINFEYHKRQLFAKAVILLIMHPSLFNFELCKKILCETQQPICTVIFLPFFFFAEIRNKILCLID